MDDFELKPLSKHGVAGAVEKAKQYRLLNEPGAAESICRDILAVDPDHREGRILLLLTLTDLFTRGVAGRYEEAHAIAQSLDDEYERHYYTGIVYERRGKAHQRSSAMAAGEIAYQWLRRAMEAFEDAAERRPEGNDEAILRWNGCVRRIRGHDELRPPHEESGPPPIVSE